MRVNVLGVANIVSVFVRHMRAHQPGPAAVEITASISSIIPGFGAYAVSKHAALAVAEELYVELADAGEHKRIRVIALCPAFVSTGLLESSHEPAVSGTTAADMEPTLVSLKTFGMPASFCVNEVRGPCVSMYREFRFFVHQ